jgi:hypothetical protein
MARLTLPMKKTNIDPLPAMAISKNKSIPKTTKRYAAMRMRIMTRNFWERKSHGEWQARRKIV